MTPQDPENAGTHVLHEDMPWTERLPDHVARSDSPEYVASRKLMNKLAAQAGTLYGPKPVQDHHGGGLWAFEDDDPNNGVPFLIRNVAGIEWSAQFCADPAKVDELRKNAVRFYRGFPKSAKALGLLPLLAEPITDADGVARWTDSICNASVPLPAWFHTGILKPGRDIEPQPAGVHHYPSPVAEVALFKRDDFRLWVTDGENQPAAVAPVSKRGSGDARVHVLYSTPGTKLHEEHRKAESVGAALVLTPEHPMAQEAFADQAA